MVAGADSIDDMDLLRHGGMGRLFTGVRAPSTLGTFLRRVHLRARPPARRVAARLLAGLAARDPGAARRRPGGVRRHRRHDARDHGYAKQGAGYGYSGVKGLNALLAVVVHPVSAPVIAATRLRKGSTNSARGAAGWSPTRWPPPAGAGATGLVLVRADSAYYGRDVIAAAAAAGARFSVTARMTPP